MDWSLCCSKSLTKQHLFVRHLYTNKTQIVHRIRLKKFVPNVPLEDKYKEKKLQPDESIIIPQDDLYTISWKADFEYELFDPRKDDWPHTATRLPNDAAAAEWTITSPKTKAAARTIMNAAAATRTKMTLLRTKYGRDRPLAETYRPL